MLKIGDNLIWYGTLCTTTKKSLKTNFFLLFSFFLIFSDTCEKKINSEISGSLWGREIIRESIQFKLKMLISFYFKKQKGKKSRAKFYSSPFLLVLHWIEFSSLFLFSWITLFFLLPISFHFFSPLMAVWESNLEMYYYYFHLFICVFSQKALRDNVNAGKMGGGNFYPLSFKVIIYYSGFPRPIFVCSVWRGWGMVSGQWCV